MNTEEILNKIQNDIANEFRKNFLGKRVEKDSTVKVCNMVRQMVDSYLMQGYTVRQIKLPRKIKKYYKKRGIPPIEITGTRKINGLKLTLEMEE